MEDLEIEPETEQIESTNETVAIEAPESLDSILGDALKSKDDSSKDVDPIEEDKLKEQVDPVKETVSTPYGEITLDEAKKLSFKNEDEFKAFLERNPFLKERVLMQSDYTKKTTQVAEERKRFAEERKQLETEKAKQSEAWGASSPTDQDMGFFHDTWHLFQHGSDQLASKISAFAKDISLIKQGQPPVGPLAGQNGSSVDYSRDSEMVGVKRKLETLEQERAREKQERETEAREAQEQASSKMVSDWLKSKSDAGNPVTDEEREVMADFASARKKDGSRYSLDELHRIALAQLGKTDKASIGKVFKSAKDQSLKTPAKPNSRVSSGLKPDANPKNLDSILEEGLESLNN